jgi:hypothetical protein
MTFHLPQRRLWRGAIYLACIFLVLIAADLVLVRMRYQIHPGFETTRIVSPTLADGSIDYLLALDERAGKGVTHENNAAVLLLAALGPQALSASQPPDGITSRLGMPHLPEQGDYLVTFDQYVGDHHSPAEEDPLDSPTPISWPIPFGPVTRQWIKDNEKPLDLISRATQRTRFFIPFFGGNRPETLIEVQLRHLKPLREAARAITIRAAMRLESGDAKGFIQDIQTARRLPRLLAQAPTFVERQVAQILETNACRVERLGLSSGKLSTDQERTIARDLLNLPDLPPIEECLESERFLVLDTTQALARRGPWRAGQLYNAMLSRSSDLPPFLFALVPIPYEETMRTMNHFYDAQITVARHPAYADRMAALKLWETGLPKTRPGSLASLLSPDWAVSLFLPNITRLLINSDIARMQSRLTQVSAALALYKSEHQIYPESLAALSPAYLKSVPTDLFSGKPLIYAPKAGGYTLYSVGANMTDDGGSPAPPCDDIVASVP